MVRAALRERRVGDSDSEPNKLVEVKSGETYNGTLVVADAWMNILLRNVVRTNKTGDQFWQLPEIYIRGSRIKYICVPDDVIDLVPRDADAKKYRPPTSSADRGAARGGRGGRGASSSRGASDRGGRGASRGAAGASRGRGGGRGGGAAGRGGH